MSPRPGMPHADQPIAKFLTETIDRLQSRKNQREIALEIGYEKPNVISMFKRGEMKVPLDKIPALARALDVDPAHLFRLAMEQYWPNQREAIEAVFGSVVTQNEARMVRFVRGLTGGKDPEMTPEVEETLRVAFKGEPR